MSEDLTFEEFNQHIDESHDDGCSMCFSFHHYAHLDQATRKVAWLRFIDKRDEYLLALMEELEIRKSFPLDDNIYFMMTGVEHLDIPDLDVRDRIMIQVLRRAYEMVKKKLPSAWVGVRAYAWMKGMDPLLLVAMLADTDDLEVWQVIFQNMNYSVPHTEKSMNENSLSLRTMKNMVYDYTKKVLAMGDEIEPYVVAVNVYSLRQTYHSLL